MRIAMLGESVPNEKKGGPDIHMEWLLHWLSEMREVDMHLVTFGKETRRFKNGRLYVHLLKRRLRASLSIPIDLFLLRSEILMIDPDIIHVQGTLFPHSTLVAMIRDRYPVVLTVHGIIATEMLLRDGYDFAKERFFVAPLERFAISRVPNIIVVTSYVKQVISRFTRSNIYVISNGVDHKFLEMESNEQPNKLLFVGRISPRKRILDIVKSMKTIIKKIPNIRLDIVGGIDSKKYANAIISYVKSKGLEGHICLTGYLSKKELVKKYKESTIVVLPSQEETQGIVLLEAMAFGKAVVASNVGGIPYVVENMKTGLLFECGNIEDLTEKIIVLLEDKELREKMGRAGREIVKDFTWKKIAERTFRLYQDILSTSQRC